MKWAGQSLYSHAICVLATHLWCSKPGTPSTPSPTLLALSWDQHSGPALKERVRACLWGARACLPHPTASGPCPLLTVCAGGSGREAPRAVGAVHRPVPLALLQRQLCARAVHPAHHHLSGPWRPLPVPGVLGKPPAPPSQD